MSTYLDQRIKEAEMDGPVHEYKAGDNLQQETHEVPLESNFVEVKGGKYYRMWHAEDLDERLIHVNLMNNALRQRFPASEKGLRHARPGDKMFVFERPVARPPELINRCRLHPNDPDRPEWDKMGLPTCSKPLANPYEVDRHMQKKHSTAWGAIERERTRRERDEDRLAQRTMMEAIGGVVAPQAPKVMDEPIIKVATPYFNTDTPPAEKVPLTRKRVDVTCDQCSYTTWSTSQTKVNNKLKKHVEDKHA